jgi:hypothetical protein
VSETNQNDFWDGSLGGTFLGRGVTAQISYARARRPKFCTGTKTNVLINEIKVRNCVHSGSGALRRLCSFAVAAFGLSWTS